MKKEVWADKFCKCCGQESSFLRLETDEEYSERLKEEEFTASQVEYFNSRHRSKKYIKGKETK